MIALDRISADDDPLLLWTAQDMRTGARAWALGDAAAVACRDVSRRDRLALRGSPDDAAELVRRIRAQVTGFNPVADAALIDALTERVDGLRLVARFGWMDTTTPAPAPVRVAGEPRWLTDAEIPEVTALLEAEHPGSWAKPGDSGVQRWAGLRDATGQLQAVAADAWSVPEIGFVAGVATRAGTRGQGLGTTLCAFVTDELIKGRSRVALLVDGDNFSAIRTYEKLGYRMRPIAAARLTGP
ncbi:GNAT family N-acetyltransferase [Actinoplanes sp. NPDC048791]|uniref:GNAT family N-acetyltransferase n=1 Tax=Actinoplanes sp. NPDC048791 TaxID=3154623 RepID=UPI0033E070B1